MLTKEQYNNTLEMVFSKDKEVRALGYTILQNDPTFANKYLAGREFVYMPGMAILKIPSVLMRDLNKDHFYTIPNYEYYADTYKRTI